MTYGSKVKLHDLNVVRSTLFCNVVKKDEYIDTHCYAATQGSCRPLKKTNSYSVQKMRALRHLTSWF